MVIKLEGKYIFGEDLIISEVLEDFSEKLVIEDRVAIAQRVTLVDRDGYHLFIENVPVYICTKCGEKHFGEDEVTTIQRLIRAVEEGLEQVRAGG